MERPRLSKSVVRVVQLQKGAEGEITPVVIYSKRNKKKKVSSVFKPIERALRDVSRAQAAFAGTYLDKHDRSNQKRSDGFVRDLAWNLAKASDNARDKIKVNRILSM